MEPSGAWSRTEDHVSASRAACTKSRCPGDGIGRDVNRQQHAALLIRPSLSSSSSPWSLADDDPTCGSLDCTLYHVHRSLVEEADTARRWSTCIVAARCVGLTPDTLIGDDLYGSIRSEVERRLGGNGGNGGNSGNSDEPDDEHGHWIERLGRSLPPGTRLHLVLANIDRLDSWSSLPASKLPDGIRLAATCSGQTAPGAGWTLMPAPAPPESPVAWNALLPGASAAAIESALDAHFDRAEKEFAPGLVRLATAALTLASAGRFPCGATEAQLRFCCNGDGDGQVASLLRALDPFLIRTEGMGGERLLAWSRPALAYVKRRYAHGAEEKRLAARRLTLVAATDSRGTETNPAAVDRLYWIARLACFVGDAAVPLDREHIADALFDWRTWRLAADAHRTGVGLHLLWAAIRHSAARWLDSQLWLLERNLPWVNQADAGASSLSPAAGLVDHLAAQLAVALRPFAEMESPNRQLWRLYQGAASHCEQFRGTLLWAPPGTWNFNHSPVPLERKVLGGQSDAIRLMSVSPDGQTLVLVVAATTTTTTATATTATTTEAGAEPMLSILAATGRRLATYRGHSGRVTCVHVTGDNEYVASGSEDLSVIVWHLASGRLLLRTREHIASVSCLSSTALGKMIVSGGEDSIVMAFQWPGGGERLARMDHHRGPVTSLTINNRQDVLVSASQDGSACVWSLDDWRLLNVISVGQAVGHVALSSDDVFLLAVGLDDGLPRLYSLTTGSPLRTWTDLPVKVAGAVIAAGNGHSCAALLGRDGRLVCYDCHGGQLVHALRTEPPGKNLVPSCCARAEDPRLVYHSVGHRISVWLLRYDERRPAPASSSVTWVAMSPLDGAVVATADASGTVHLWRTANVSKIASWSHPSAVSALSFDAAAGSYVASGAEDGTCAVWHLDAGQTLQASQIHPAGCRVNQLVVVADWNGYVLSCDVAESVIQWKLGTGEVVRQWHQVASKAIGVALNTRWMAGLVGSHCARIWSLDSGDDTKETVSVSHTEEVLCFAVTPDSKHLITGSKDSSLKMWEAVPSVATEKPGKLVQIMAGHSDHVTAVVAANVVSSSNGAPLERQSSNAGSNGACARRHLVVVSGSRDGQLIAWDAQHGSETHSMKRHRAAVTCLRVSTDGTVLVSGSEDGTVRAWNLRTGHCLSSFALALPVQQIAMSPDASKVWVRMAQKALPAILELKHTPAALVKPEPCSRPASPVHLKKPPPTRRLLKKEISLDSYTWLKRYGAKSSSGGGGSGSAAVHQAAPQSTPSVDSLLKLSRRNSFCNVPESGET